MNTTDEEFSPSDVRSSYTLLVEFICCAALLANILLIVVYVTCPLKSTTSKYFFILSITQNIVSSVTFFLTAPRPISFKWTLLFVCTGRGSEWFIGPFIFLLYSMTFVSSMIFVTNSFIYKYIQLCRPWKSSIYSSAKWLISIVLINFAIVVNWMAMSVFCGWPSKEFIQMFRNYVKEYHQFDLIHVTFMGISMDHGLTTLTFILLVESLVLVLIVGCVGFTFAIAIHLYLARLAIGTHLQNSHQQLFTLLLIQTACPVFLLHIPLYTMYGLLFTGARAPYGLSIIIGILMSLFPLVGPLIILALIKEYRKFILSKLKLKRSEASSVTRMKQIDKAKSISVAPYEKK